MLFSIKWLLNIEICLARVLLVYACYYWFLIKYSITDSTYKIRAFSYFPLKLVNTQFNWSGFHQFVIGLRNSFLFLASIVKYFLLMSSRNLFLATGSMLSYICFFLRFLMMHFLSISVILREQQINCRSYSIWYINPSINRIYENRNWTMLP